MRNRCISSIAAGVLAALLLLPATMNGAEQDVLGAIRARWARDAASVKDLKIEFTEKLAGSGMSVEAAAYIKGDRFRLESAVPAPAQDGKEGQGEIRTVMIMGPKGAWLATPMGKIKMDVKELGVEAQKFLSNPGIPADAAVRGAETVNGRECHVIAAEEKGIPLTYWVDKKELVLVKMAGELKGKRIEVVNEDFRKTGLGFSYPYRTENFFDGNPASVRTVRKLTVNQGLPDHLFDPDSLPGGDVDMNEILKGLGGAMPGQEP